MSLTDCHRGMSLTDCREDDQMVNSSYQGMLTNQMPPLKRVDDEVDADGKQTTRMKKMTKGLQYKLDQLRERRSKLHSKLIRKSGMIEELTYSWVNAAAVREEMDQFNDVLKLFTKVHREYQELLCEEDLPTDTEWFEEFDEKVFSFKHKLFKWMKEGELNDKEEVKSHKSVCSSKSKSSSGSPKSGSSRRSKCSIEEKVIDEKIKVTELITEANYVEQKMKMEYEKKRLEMEEKVAIAKARAKVLDDLTTDEQKEQPHVKTEMKKSDDNKNKGINLKEDYEEFITGKKFHTTKFNSFTKNVLDENQRSEREISKYLCKLIKQQGAPEVDIDTFAGDPLEYHYFMEVFKEVVEKRIEDPRGRLTCLIKYTSGEAKDLIKHCIQQPLSQGYKTVKELLESRYGDPLTILAVYRKEIKRWPMIKAGDAAAFRSFHNFLLKCQSVVLVQRWNGLDSPRDSVNTYI